MTPVRKLDLAKWIFLAGVLMLLVAWPWYGDTFIYLGDAAVAVSFIVVAA